MNNIPWIVLWGALALICGWLLGEIEDALWLTIFLLVVVIVAVWQTIQHFVNLYRGKEPWE